MKKFSTNPFPKKPGKLYPEQSARQSLRAQRRAQGGPGITEGKDPLAKRAVFYIDLNSMTEDERKVYLEKIAAEVKNRPMPA